MFPLQWLSSLKNQLRTHSTRTRRNSNRRNQAPFARALVSRNVIETLEDRTLLTAMLSISDVTALENETFTFEISLDEVAGSDITVLVNTESDTADNSDYTFLKNKLVTIPAGELSTQVRVHVHDDDLQETDEIFSLVLSDPLIGGVSLPSAVTIADETGQGTILNDDGLPGSVFTISGEKIVEGNDGYQILEFTIIRTAGSPGDLSFDTSVEFNTVNGTAVAGEDYIGISEVVHFSAIANATSQTSVVYVFVQGDTYKELSETVIGRLNNPTNGSFLKGNVSSLDAVGIITNDDSDFVFQNTFSADPIHANHTRDAVGSSVALDGDTMVVGAPSNSYGTGVVYVYARNQHGTLLDQTDDTWDYQTFLQPPVPLENVFFADSVALYGDTIVVSAILDTSNVVYVFTRMGDDWKTENPRVEVITVDALFYFAGFGNSLAIYENTIVVGAIYDASTGVLSGAAYIFQKTGDDWSTPSIRKLAQPVSDYTDFFGGAVAIHGDLIVVGAYRNDDNGSNSGAAYVYTKVGESWIANSPLVAKLIASDGMADDGFGFSVATNGTDILVGAISEHGVGNVHGSAYLYVSNSLDWSSASLTEIKFSSNNASFEFGYSVAISDDRLLLGEPYGTNNGVAYVYTKSGSEWDINTVVESFVTHSADSSYSYAASVAISGNTIVIGASYESFDGFLSGGAYAFEEAGNNSWLLTTEINPTEISTRHNGADYFGQAIAVSDDYLVISAPGTDSALAPTGIVYVYAKNDAGTPDFYGDDTWVYETSLIDPEPELNREFGASVAIDGKTIIVSAKAMIESEVYVYTRNGLDWVTIAPTVTPLLANASRDLRRDISIAIQHDTIVVGNPDAFEQVYVYQKNGSNWSTIAPTESVISASGGTPGDRFGTAVDIDGDKIIVGAEEYDNRGAAFLYHKGTSGWDSAAETKLIGFDLQGNNRFGSSVAIEGDTVVVGAPYGGVQNGGVQNYGYGAVYIFNGGVDWYHPVVTKITPAINVYTLPGSFGKNIAFDGMTLVTGTRSAIPGQFESAYIYDSADGWDNFKETIIFSDTNSEFSPKGFGNSAIAVHGNSIFISALLESTNASSRVYSFSRFPATIEQRVVNSPTNTLPTGEANSLPSNQDNVSEWSSYWVEIWVNASNPENQGVFSAQLNLDYNTEYTSATEIEFGSGFTQNQTGTINDVAGTVEGLYAETTASDLGADSYLLFARIKFESLAEDQVELDLSGQSIGPYDLGFHINSQQVTLVGNLPVAVNSGLLYGTSIWANPFDLNDDDVINVRDLARFISVYGSTPSQSNSDYAWFADLNQNDRVEFQELLLFVGNYGKSKASQSPVNYPENFPEAWNQLLTVETPLLPQASAQPVTQAAAETVLESVVEQVSPQLTPDQSEKLEHIHIEVVDLAGDTLGRAAAGTIYIDVNAAGQGWFVDGSPADHSEFTVSSALTLIALPDSEAAGSIDLWTVILHELGHLLGYEHETDGVMQDSLAPGVRKLPDWEVESDLFFSGLTEDSNLIDF